MGKLAIEELVERLRNAPLSDSYHQPVDTPYCVLGVLTDVEGIMNTTSKGKKYKPTIRTRIRNTRERLGYWVGSKIAGYNLDNREWDYQ